jgi:hypothetical protein
MSQMVELGKYLYYQDPCQVEKNGQIIMESVIAADNSFDSEIGTPTDTTEVIHFARRDGHFSQY